MKTWVWLWLVGGADEEAEGRTTEELLWAEEERGHLEWGSRLSSMQGIPGADSYLHPLIPHPHTTSTLF